MSRTKCSFWRYHVSRLESLVFPWLRRVYRGSCTTSPFWRFPSRLLRCFAWQAWHCVTFQPVLYRVDSSFVWLAQQSTPHFTLYTLLHTLHSTLYTPDSTLYTPTHSTLYTPHFPLCTPHFTLYTLHSTLLHSTLHTPHSTTLYTLHTPHS